ncbi:aminotransferase DegT [Desulfosarcina ovata subsp. sediminis]|uniref:Aminotransferase DegT n=1 Tax=Desulfosarcina ovata subsp. sediminis TaxID=885957 RepID=A0A5K7ZQN9_9BACT|nr:DegT/DnrJ/EryC1/StrS family aminotransferase [Desulfosarcina ovata]BBO79773.1 aminotransferase DegT [Desulfosarcina ovata subsp. sediminis]
MPQMRIPFGTVAITDESKRLINDCLENGRISSGRLVARFEERFAELIGAGEAVAVGSGTDADALSLAVLHDLGASSGDEVIVPALTFVATANAVLQAGFKPIFVDVHPETFNIDPARIENAVTDRTRAILPVHLMGKPADMTAINTIARRNNLLVIEDAAEAHGARYKNKNIGCWGDMAAYSLYVAHIITTGEGGIVVTDNAEYASILRSLRSHGRACKCKKCISNTTSGYCAKRFADAELGDIRFRFERIGFSSKMNELEAAIGLGALTLYDEILTKRRENLYQLIKGFQNFSDYFYTFSESDAEKIGPHAFPFVLRENTPFTRFELMHFLEQNGVDARTLFASIPTQCGGYKHFGYHQGDFPVAEMLGRQGVHIGVHQDIGRSDIKWFLELTEMFLNRFNGSKNWLLQRPGNMVNNKPTVAIF